MAYTTADFLSSIERKSFSPDNQSTFDTSALLAIADEILKGEILPEILDVREEFFITYKDYAVEANKAAYDLPARALTIREVHLIDSTGQIVNTLPRVNPEEISGYGSGQLRGFYLRNNQIILYRTPTSTQYTLRVLFFTDLGKLVETTATAVISAIDTATNTVTVSTIPSTWVTGNTFDFLRRNGNHEYIGMDYTSSTVSGTDIIFSSLPSNLSVGDYICLEGESALIQLPPNFRPAFSMLTAAEILLSQGQPGGEERLKRGKDLLARAKTFITPRVQGEPEIITPTW